MKGLSLRNYPRVLEELRGKHAVEVMIRSLPSDLRTALANGGIVAGGWYPIAWKCALHDAGKRATGDACEGALAVAGAGLIRLRVEAGARDGDEHATAVAWWDSEAAESARDSTPEP